jgi:hypothetical protein
VISCFAATLAAGATICNASRGQFRAKPISG